MKRDWDLIRKQLICVEEEDDSLTDTPEEPIQGDQEWDVYVEELEKYVDYENKYFGHLELLVDNEYIDGLNIIRSSIAVGTIYKDKFHVGLFSPRLTMAGHDLLDTMRSSGLWEKVKETAETKGIELTFDTIKVLAASVLTSLL